MSSELGNHPEEIPAKKPSKVILRQEVTEAVEALEMPTGRLAVSGLSAGLDLGFSLLLMGIIKSFNRESLPEWAVEFMMANAYAFGFIAVVLGRSELFTEQTSLAILPLLSGRTSVLKVARLWTVVFISNIAGTFLFAAFAAPIGLYTGIVDSSAYGEISRRLVELSWWRIFWSGILAGWLMGLVSWLVAAARDTISQIVIVWLITGAIGFVHLHHSILSSTEVLSGVFWGPTTWAQYGHFLLWAALGNATGGPVMVALIKFGHSYRRED